MEDAKLEKLLDVIATGVARVEKKGDETNSRVETLGSKVETLGSKVETLEANVISLRSDFGRLETKVVTLQTDSVLIKNTVIMIQTDFHEFKGTMLSSVDRVMKAYSDFAVEKVAIDVTLHRHDSEIRNLQKSVDKLQQEIIRLSPPL